MKQNIVSILSNLDRGKLEIVFCTSLNITFSVNEVKIIVFRSFESTQQKTSSSQSIKSVLSKKKGVELIIKFHHHI
jgi:hypothetical protein